MKTRYYILFLISCFFGKIESKTIIQKAMYFLDLKNNLGFGFRPHYFGPYSSKVENALGELIGLGFVEQKKNSLGFDSNNGFEIRRYDQELTPDGEQFVELIKKRNPTEFKKVKEFSELLNKTKINYFNLSIAAKSYFILNKEKKPLTRVDIMKKAHQFDWEIKNEDFSDALSILTELNLIEEN